MPHNDQCCTSNLTLSRLTNGIFRKPEGSPATRRTDDEPGRSWSRCGDTNADGNGIIADPVAKLGDGEGELACRSVEGYRILVCQSEQPQFFIEVLGLVRECSLQFLARVRLGDAPKSERPRLKERCDDERLGCSCKGVSGLLPPDGPIRWEEKPAREYATRIVMLLRQPYEAKCEFSATIHRHSVRCRANA